MNFDIVYADELDKVIMNKNAGILSFIVHMAEAV